jgi:hypothetical protein
MIFRWSTVSAVSLFCLLVAFPVSAQEAESPSPAATPTPASPSIGGTLVYPDVPALTPAPAEPEIEGTLTYPGRQERILTIAPTSIGEEVDFVGHIERLEDPYLIVLGRQVDPTFARIRGGWRKSLVPGTLVRVRGRGAGNVPLRPDSIEIIPMTDPDLDYKLRKASEDFKNKFFKKAREFHDPDVIAYLKEIGRRLLPSYLAGQGSDFYYHVVDDPVANAFVLPDGTVVVHTGLIAQMKNEAQLATVLGHEFAHWSQRHAARMMAKSKEHTLLSIGSMIASIALGTMGGADKAQAAQGIQLMTSAYFSGYSREFEDEADQVGLRYLFLGGYDVREAPNVWEIFRILYGDEDDLVNVFYGTHSTSKERQFLLNSEIDISYGAPEVKGGRIGLEDFKVKMAPVFRENAVLLMKRGLYDWAERQLRAALEGNPKDAEAWVKLGDVILKKRGAHGRDEALIAYRRALEIEPENKEARSAVERVEKESS